MTVASTPPRSDLRPRRLWLCADDYGIAPGVNRAIRDLLARGRINATSVMVVGPSFSAAEAQALTSLSHPPPLAGKGREGASAAIGLHFTLTAPFCPASADYRPVGRDGAFRDLPRTFAAGWLRRLDAGALAAEAASQFAAFRRAFGRPPDFVDGHQHVQLLPQVGDALMAIMKEAAPSAWLRQCGRAVPLSRRWRDPKGLALDLMSARLAARSARRGIATNPAFAGTYNFRRNVPYEALFALFLDHLPDGGLVMCHPGFVEPELRRLDDFLAMREVEHDFFAGERFPQLLASHSFALA
jgi:predicted glycoside hydrolase/deacetylase ChbG (UPF0249 family)